jgi:hypothetical protein
LNTKIHQFLNQPYPFYYRGTELMVFIIVIFAMALFFNYSFEPFTVNRSEHKMSYFWISVIHSLSPIVIVLLLSILLYFNKNLVDSWTLKKELTFFFWLLLLTGIAQFLIRDLIYDNPQNWSWHYLQEEVRNTLLVGMLFAAILIPLNLNRLLLQNQKKALEISKSLNKKTIPERKKLTIRTKLKSDDFNLDPYCFLYAKADGNYMEIYVLEQGRTEKQVRRIPMKDLENQLQAFSWIVKTHRSFLVNLKYVEEVNGNAQGYRLTLKHIQESIPVSRYSITSFEASLKAFC